MAEEDDFQAQLGRVRPVTRHLVESLMLDAWPRQSAIVDFGLSGQAQYEALYYPVRNGEITPESLDAALGDGAKLTALVRSAASNPHKDVTFTTSWDVVQGRAAPQRKPKSPGEIARDADPAAADDAKRRDKGRGR